LNIDLPYKWNPRDYQHNLWKALGSDLKRFLAVWHRRAGKDDVMMHHNACAAFERVGNYWYCLPEYNQCRKAIWDAINPHSGKKRVEEAFPEQIRSNTNNQEMKITFKNGSMWQLMGSDNYNSLVGSPPVGITFSEYALSNPTSWGYLRPILLENGGWASFNTTPRGKNHVFRMAKMAEESEEWFYEKLTAEQTSVFTSEQLQGELQELIAEHGDEAYARALWLQEYWCSFDAALPGSIWGAATANLIERGGLGIVPHKSGYPVHTAWDLGRDDFTSVWFYQCIDGALNVIDCYEDNFKEIEDYAKMLYDKGKERDFRYGKNWLPHDAKPVRMGMGGKSQLQQFMDQREEYISQNSYDIGIFDIVPNFSQQEGIQAARKTFHIANFDKLRCEDQFEHLKSYHRKRDDDTKMFSKEPVHDLHSHASDAWRYLSLTWKMSKQTQTILSEHQQLINGAVGSITFGQMKNEFLRKQRLARSNRF
jgi:hypothetical protein